MTDVVQYADPVEIEKPAFDIQDVEELKKVIKLDKDKLHGTVNPPIFGAHFVQGEPPHEFYFDHNGELITHPNVFSPEHVEKLKKIHLRRQADKAANEARKKFMAQSGMTEEDL